MTWGPSTSSKTRVPGPWLMMLLPEVTSAAGQSQTLPCSWVANASAIAIIDHRSFAAISRRHELVMNWGDSPRSMHHKGSVGGDVSITLQSNGSSIWVHSDWRYEIPCNLKLHVYVFQTTYLTGMEPGASVELGFKSVSNHSASCSSQAKLEVTTRRMRAMYYYIEWLAPRRWHSIDICHKELDAVDMIQEVSLWPRVSV